MVTYILYLSLSFGLILVTAVLISYCKRRQNRTSHGLTGMCHESGGTMCSCCSSHMHSDTMGASIIEPEET